MKWTRAKQDILRLYWQDETDKELGVRLGATAKAVQHKRIECGLDRRGSEYCKNYFVIQVTNWLPTQNSMVYWSDWLKEQRVEHVVAESNSRYALFRPRVGFLPVVQEPPRTAWVLHWSPN